MDKFQDLLQRLENNVRDRRWGDYMNQTKLYNMFKDIGAKLNVFKTSQEMLSNKIEKSIKFNEMQRAKQEEHIQSLQACIENLNMKIEKMNKEVSQYLSSNADVKSKSKRRTFFDDSSFDASLDDSSEDTFFDDGKKNPKDNALKPFKVDTSNIAMKRKNKFITPEKSNIFEYFTDDGIDSDGLFKGKKKNLSIENINTQMNVVKNPYKKLKN